MRRLGTGSHVVDHDLAEARARHLRRAVHQPGEVIGHALAQDGLFHRRDDEVGSLGPADVAQHHLGGQDGRTGVHIVLAGVLRRRAMGGLEQCDGVAHVGARRDADAAHLGRQRVGDVVAIQVERRDHAVLGRPQDDLLQEGVGNAVLDGDGLAGLRVLEPAPRATVDRLGTKFLLRQRIGPVAEGAFGVLHDVALVHDGHAGLVVVDGVLDGLSDQPFGALLADGLDTQARGLGEANLVGAEFITQEAHQLAGLLAAGLELDAGIDVFRVLAEDHHVHLVRLLHRAGHAVEVLHGPQADVEIELLAQRDVQRADATAHRRRQRALDRDDIVLEHPQRLLRQPDLGAIDARALVTGVDLHPVDLARTAVGLGHRRVHHLEHDGRDVDAGAIAFDEGNDGLVRDVQRQVGVDGDLLATFGHLDVLVHGVWDPLGRGENETRRV
mmetsp:Transcript_1099/g.1707  ORF Transcript_1099/g.1707 Transcript_1099/m.1707 type:complete len:442 (-) Transcript_1099:93-1418(-)